MTTTEHLAKIRARCVELLEIASNRTPGTWSVANGNCELVVLAPGGSWKGSNVICDVPKADALFIASCAGPAEAGWRATVIAIDALENGTGSLWTEETNSFSKSVIDSLIAAWPEEILV